eukprot:2782361-Alexandrium_andersonii.AAC.1
MWSFFANDSDIPAPHCAAPLGRPEGQSGRDTRATPMIQSPHCAAPLGRLELVCELGGCELMERGVVVTSE